MTLFSERNGYVEPKTILIKEQLTPEIQNAICSCFDDLKDANAQLYVDMEKYIWSKYLNQRKGSYRITYVIVTSFIENNHNIWHKKIDIVEKCVEFTHSQNAIIAKGFVKNLNKEFERLHFAYRIVNNLFVEIVSNEEISSIETALASQQDSVKLHLQTAICLYAKRPDGEYRNSIKESISAVEAIIREITGEKNINFKKMERAGVKVPIVLREAFNKLYGYTNEETTGIRHALMDEENAPTADEAIFMLISCSAFVNYLTKKISK